MEIDLNKSRPEQILQMFFISGEEKRDYIEKLNVTQEEDTFLQSISDRLCGFYSKLTSTFPA